MIPKRAIKTTVSFFLSEYFFGEQKGITLIIDVFIEQSTKKSSVFQYDIDVFIEESKKVSFFCIIHNIDIVRCRGSS
jgi:hypothetical protein